MDEIEIDGVIGAWDVDVKEILQMLSNAKGDLLVKLNSPGGSVIDGITLYNAFKKYDNGTVTIEIGAAAASIASYIALSADKVVAHSNSVYMIHLAWISAVGNYIDLRKAADISEGLSSLMADVYSSKTKMEKSDAIILMEKETFYYGAEMLEAGFVDEIIDVSTTSDKASALAITLEGLKACNSAVVEHEDSFDYEAVAKLFPKEEPKAVKKEEVIPEVVDLSAQQQRARALFILEQGIK